MSMNFHANAPPLISSFLPYLDPSFLPNMDLWTLPNFGPSTLASFTIPFPICPSYHTHHCTHHLYHHPTNHHFPTYIPIKLITIPSAYPTSTCPPSLTYSLLHTHHLPILHYSFPTHFPWASFLPIPCMHATFTLHNHSCWTPYSHPPTPNSLLDLFVAFSISVFAWHAWHFPTWVEVNGGLVPKLNETNGTSIKRNIVRNICWPCSGSAWMCRLLHLSLNWLLVTWSLLRLLPSWISLNYFSWWIVLHLRRSQRKKNWKGWRNIKFV